MSILSETPDEINDLILNLVLDIRAKTLDFYDAIILLTRWHNKKLVRELILEALNNIEVINEDDLEDWVLFIIDLLDIDEIGLAKKVYDLLIYSHEIYFEDIHVKNVDRENVRYEHILFFKDIHNDLIKRCSKYDIPIDRVLKIFDHDHPCYKGWS
jgi:hypothetical protein